jgi:hypothetical protein
MGTDPQISQLTCFGLCREPFFRSSEIRLNLSMTHKRLLCIDRMRYVWSGIIRGLSVGGVWCVGRVFHCRVYNDLNHHDSRI